ncbi:MAG: hypothetical protein LQ337_002679 [Flavoplaca oasis]|nr:MAG: hypothetical protein LQ337_002679 [Flavoplaca oasis]
MSKAPDNVLKSSEEPATYPVEIRFVSQGAQPPIYVAGSFTQPEWQLHELNCSIVEHDGTTSSNDTSFVFHRTFDLPQGTYQYKFRLGHGGDWWVCDHGTDIVTDALGNQNNCLVVDSPRPRSDAIITTATDETLYPQNIADKTAQPSMASPANNRLKDLLHRDERGQTDTEGSPLAVPDEDQGLVPSESLRRRKSNSARHTWKPSANVFPMPPINLDPSVRQEDQIIPDYRLQYHHVPEVLGLMLANASSRNRARST